MRPILLLAVLVACKQPADTGDHDGDGVLDDDDCDPNSPEVGAGTARFHDADADGFGDAAVSKLVCEEEGGWVVDATDCDDSDPDVFVGHAETCNGRNDDCNEATVDEGIISIGSDVYTSLALSIAAAQSGDTLMVCPGTWTGIASVGSGVTLESLSGPELTILDAAGAGTVVTALGDLTIRGFTLRGGVSAGAGGGGLLAETCSSIVVEDSVIDGNSGAMGGGVLARCALTLNDTTVSNNTADTGGGVAVVGPLTLFNARINDNTATGDAGGLLISGADAQITRSVLRGNHAARGGGLAWDPSAVVAAVLMDESSAIAENTAEAGGGVAVDGALVATIRGGAIVRNDAPAGGGIEVSDGAQVTIEGTFFEGNTATDGGAIHAGGAASITDAVFVNDVADQGADVFCAGRLDADGTTFQGGTATDGASLFLEGDTTLSDCTFLDSTATRAGGAIFQADGTLSTSGVRIQETAAVDGGGLYQAGGTAVLTQTHFLRGVASATGGGLRVAGTLSLQSSTVSHGHADIGGCVDVEVGGQLDAADSVLTACHADTDGGGVMLHGIANLVQTGIEGHATTGDGGALWVDGIATLNQASLHDSTAYSGAGLLVDGGGAVTADGAVFTTNTAGRRGGGARIVDGTLTCTACSFGEEALDNGPDDVSVHVGATNPVFVYGEGVSFVCDTAGSPGCI